MNNLKLDTITNTIAAMNLDYECMFKQTKELNSILYGLKAKIHHSMEKSHILVMPTDTLRSML